MVRKNQPRLRLVVVNEETTSDVEAGYKSGRSSCREMPETRSTVNTRSAGIRPERRHFWTAWYFTPQLEAKAPKLSAPEMARSTAFMDESMQPIVALSQQPLRAHARRRIQPMVVRNKEEAREEFAKNLNIALDNQKAPKRGRADWLRTKIGKIVSRESCRKWLAGEDMPDQGNLSVILEVLGLNEQQLRTGKWSAPPGNQDERLTRITKSWPSLPENLQNAIMAIVDGTTTAQESDRTPKARRA